MHQYTPELSTFIIAIICVVQCVKKKFKKNTQLVEEKFFFYMVQL